MHESYTTFLDQELQQQDQDWQKEKIYGFYILPDIQTEDSGIGLVELSNSHIKDNFYVP